MVIHPTIKIGVFVALIGIPTFLTAAEWKVVGNNRPDQHQPANAKTLKTFVETHASHVSVEDMREFTAQTVHGDRTALAQASAVAPKLAGAKTGEIESAVDSVGQLPAATRKPCPKGFQMVQRFAQTGNVSCEQDQRTQGGLIVATSLMLDAAGQGLQTTSNFGENNFTYGSMSQRVIDERPGHLLYAGQYDSYFFGTRQEADVVLKYECGLGFPVTYVGPSGTIKNGVPSGGYQVKVANYLPGTNDLSPLPPGEADLCATLAPQGTSN